MINVKPTASLSSGLLARKGQARPAMRPQGFPGFGSVAGALDDLGWNDMGQGEAEAPEPIAAVAAPAPQPAPASVAMPSVLRERAVLKAEIEAPVAEPRALKTKAAFTLRLDHDRHLRLRLASALAGRSAQALVTEALDAFLTKLPNVEEMARRLEPRGGDEGE